MTKKVSHDVVHNSSFLERTLAERTIPHFIAAAFFQICLNSSIHVRVSSGLFRWRCVAVVSLCGLRRVEMVFFVCMGCNASLTRKAADTTSRGRSAERRGGKE